MAPFWHFVSLAIVEALSKAVFIKFSPNYRIIPKISFHGIPTDVGFVEKRAAEIFSAEYFTNVFF